MLTLYMYVRCILGGIGLFLRLKWSLFILIRNLFSFIWRVIEITCGTNFNNPA